MVATSDHILALAREAIHADYQKPLRCLRWYVMLDKQRVAPKWLVSQLTGLPVQAFHTHQAIRLLTQLGIEVRSSNE